MMTRLWPLVAVMLLLAACGGNDVAPVSVAPRTDAALADFVGARKDAAKQLEAAGDMVEALRQWRIVAAAAPQDEEARARIADLTEALDGRKAELRAEVDAAFGRKQWKQAETAYLKLLLLDGGDVAARDRLREIDRIIALANQGRKDDKAMAEYRASLARAQDTSEEFEAKANVSLKKGDYRKVIDTADQFLKRNPDHKAALDYRKQGYLGLAGESRRRGNYQEALTYLDTAAEMAPEAEKPGIVEKAQAVRGELALKLYSEGLAMMSTDVDEAIALLTRALEYNPDHLQTRRSLLQARKMQETLRKIPVK